MTVTRGVSSDNGIKFGLNLFSNLVDSKIINTMSIIEFASQTHLMSDFAYKSNVSEKLHGIPGDLEKSKRELLSDILKSNPDIATIFLVLPNGNIYLGEPFSDQEQLPRLNFADREWFEVVSAQDTIYVSSIFQSAAINAPAIALAVPIYSGDTRDYSKDPTLANISPRIFGSYYGFQSN